MVVAALAGGAGCAPTVYYGYQYRLTQELNGAEQPEAASAEARQLLGMAKAVAFYPPDACLNNETSAQKDKELHASCGVLLSTLERAAERAGYEVLSWQNLRGSRRPIDFAREANVDVLFEINQFEPGDIKDSDVQRTLAFFERSAQGIDAPVQVSSQLAQRCVAYAAQRDAIQTAALAGTIDIKTVSVSDGRSRWRYRKTLAQSLGRSYPQVMFAGRGSPSKIASLLSVVGAVTVGIGGGLLLAEVVSTDDPATGQTKFDSSGVSTDLMIGGAVALGAAAIAGIALAGDKPAPDAVLCNEITATAPAAAAIDPGAAGAVASQHTFTEAGVGDPLQKKKDKIRDTMIADFIAVLAEAHAAPRVPRARPAATPDAAPAAPDLAPTRPAPSGPPLTPGAAALEP